MTKPSPKKLPVTLKYIQSELEVLCGHFQVDFSGVSDCLLIDPPSKLNSMRSVNQTLAQRKKKITSEMSLNIKQMTNM